MNSPSISFVVRRIMAATELMVFAAMVAAIPVAGALLCTSWSDRLPHLVGVGIAVGILAVLAIHRRGWYRRLAELERPSPQSSPAVQVIPRNVDRWR